MSNGLNTKSATIIEKLDLIIGKLDGDGSILEVLHDIQTDTTSLAQTQLTMSDTLTDVHTDTQSMDGKLLTIRNTLTDVHTDTQSMDGKLLTIRDTLDDVHTDTQSMDAKLLTIRDTLADIYTQVLNLAPGSFDWEAVLGTPAGSTDNILEWLASILNSLGQPTGDATTTALGRLATIQSLETYYFPRIVANTGACPCGAAAPASTNICADPYVSGGMFFFPASIVPGLGSINTAIWTTLPATLEYGTIFGLTDDQTSLVPASGEDWSGWSLYVESGAEAFSLSTTGLGRYQTNEWLDLTPLGTTEIAVMVDASAAVRAYLCPDGSGSSSGGSWGGGSSSGGDFCIAWTPEQMETEATSNGDRFRPVLSLHDITGHAIGDGTDSAMYDDWSNWTYTATGVGMQAYYWANDTDFQTMVESSPSVEETVTGTIPAQPGPFRLLFQSYVAVFTLELCPPE